MSVHHQSETARGVHREPPLATADERAPDMATQTYDKGNGEDRAMFPMFKEFVGKVRAGWVTAVIIISVVTNVATHLVIAGWVIAPAKSSDVEKLTSAVAGLTEAMKPIPAAIIRLEESQKANIALMQSIDRKLEVLIARPATPAQPRVIVKRTGFFGN